VYFLCASRRQRFLALNSEAIMEIESVKLLRRAAAAEYLRQHGFPVSRQTLAKLACRGGGPAFRRFGRVPLYAPCDLAAWATGRLGAAATSTAQADAA